MAVSGDDLWVRTGPTLGSISPTGVYRAVMGALPRGGGGSAGRLSCSFGFPYPLVPAAPGLVGLSVFDVVALGEDGVEVLAEIDPGLRAAVGFGSLELDVVGRDVLVLVLSGAAATYSLSTWGRETGWRSASAGDLSDYNFASGLHPPDTITCGSDGRCFAPAWGPRGAIEVEDWASVRSILLESPEGSPLAGPWTPVSGVEGVAGVRAPREGEPVAMGACRIWLRDAGGGWKGTDVRGGPCAKLPPWSTCLPAVEDGKVAEACRTAEWPEMTWAVACGTKVVVRFLWDSGFWVVDPDAGDTSASMSLPRIEDVDEMASWAGGVAVLSAGTLLWYSCEGI
jgi:hypothetical protein